MSQEQKHQDSDVPKEPTIEDCLAFAPQAGAILAALLRGLNDRDDMIRLNAVKGLLDAFPLAENTLAPLVLEIEADDPKVRLAAIERILIVLPQVLAASSGLTLDKMPSCKRPHTVMEDAMENAGKWIAWSQDRQRILAVASSFAAVMKQALALGEADPYVKRAPGVAPEIAGKRFEILEDESPDIMDDISKAFPEPEAWLEAPNEMLGGEKPRDLLKTAREQEVRYLLRGIKDGIMT